MQPRKILYSVASGFHGYFMPVALEGDTVSRPWVYKCAAFGLAVVVCFHIAHAYDDPRPLWVPFLELTLLVSLGGLAFAMKRLRRQNQEQKKLQEEALQYALFPLHNPFPLLRFNREGVVIMANPAAMELFDITLEKQVTLPSLLKDADYLKPAELIERGDNFSHEHQIGPRWFKFSFVGIPALGFGHAYGSDITNLRETEENLKSSEQFLRTVIDADPNLIFVKDSQCRFRLVNEAVARIYGTTTGELIGKSDGDFNPQTEEVEWFHSDDRRVLETREDIFIPQEKITDAAGNERFLQTHKRPIFLPHTSEVHVLGVSTDITENRQLQSQLLQAQKMEAVGLLAGGVAHDFNNLLTGIFGFTGLLRLNHGDNPDILALTQSIEGAASRASQLTQKLLGFARKGKYQNVPVDIHATISETLQILGRTIEKNINIVQNLEAQRADVLGDPIQLQQLILNLVINARDAMSKEAGGTDGGDLIIETRVLPHEKAFPLHEQSLRTGDFLQVVVKDTGCGIPAEIKDKIFEPFFTTKDPERGTGMGLAMVYGIARSHCGVVEVRSEPGKGAVFEILLPLIQEGISSKVEKTAVYAGQRPTRKQGRILLVEDHSITRDAAARMLQAVGYQVITASDGIEAVNCYKRNHAEIDLVIVDMVMPRMGARECFREIRKINPRVKVILATGYANSQQVQEIVAEGMAGFMQKPLRFDQLSEVVAYALSQ